MAKRPQLQGGMSAGISYWILFMVLFLLLGYSTYLSIALGAIGGLSIGTIAAWLNPKEVDDLPVVDATMTPTVERKPELSSPNDSTSRPRFQPYGLMGPRRRPTKAVRRFRWLFRKNP